MSMGSSLSRRATRTREAAKARKSKLTDKETITLETANGGKLPIEVTSTSKRLRNRAKRRRQGRL